MNPGITIKKNNISSAQKTGRQYYAWTDQGMIFGSTEEIVQRKIQRLGAGPYKQPPKDKLREIDPEHEYDLPF